MRPRIKKWSPQWVQKQWRFFLKAESKWDWNEMGSYKPKGMEEVLLKNTYLSGRGRNREEETQGDWAGAIRWLPFPPLTVTSYYWGDCHQEKAMLWESGMEK